MKLRHFLFTLLTLCVNLSASASDWTDANGTVWTFSVEDNKASIEAVSGTIPENLTIPNTLYIDETSYSVTTIGNSAFSNCSTLTSVTIPESVTSIGASAFDGCSGLTSVTVNFVNPLSIDADCFSNRSNATLFVPMGSKAAYEAATYWMEFKEIVELLEPDAEGRYPLATAQDVVTFAKMVNNGNTTLDAYLTADIDFAGLDDSWAPIGSTNNSASRYCGTFDGQGHKFSHMVLNQPEKSDFGMFNTGANVTLKNFTLDSTCSITGARVVGLVGNHTGANALFENIGNMAPVDGEGDNVGGLFGGAWAGNATVTINSCWVAGDITTRGPKNPANCAAFSGWCNTGTFVFNDCCTTARVPNSTNSARYLVRYGGTVQFHNCYSVYGTQVPRIAADAVASGELAYKMNGNHETITWYQTLGEDATPVADSTHGIVYYDYQTRTYSNDTGVLYSSSIIFADANVKAVCVQNWDTNGDGELSYAEAASVTSIGSVFINNSSISSFDELQYFGGVTSIENYAFQDCSSLTSVIIPEGVTSIRKLAFQDCSSLTSVIIPSSVTSIGINAFSGCSSLTSVTIPEGVTSIGDYTFSRCSSLTSVTIPEGVTSIGREAFSGCSSLTSVTIPESVTSIGDYAFSGCTSLTSVTIPEGVTSIGREAFSGCSSLTSVTIPENVTSIGDYAFSGCSSLTSVTIPEGVTSIGGYAFRGCSGLTSVTIPEGVTSIKDGAFYGCSGLTSVIIPESVTSIGSNAFEGCSSLTSVTIPDGVTSIGDYAFSGCSGLTSVTIPEGVTSIGDGAFYECSGLTSVTIPSSVTLIGSGAFSSTICLLIQSTSPFAHEGVDADFYIVPDVAVDAYKEAWTDKADKIFGAADYAVKSYTVTAKDESSALLDAIGGEDYTFNILKLKVSGSINSYDMMIMRNKMVNLCELDLSDATIVANSYCYSESRCSEDNVFPNFMKGKTKLFSVVLPTSITKIGYEALSGCSSITHIDIPASVTTIESSAFSCCSSLKTITLGAQTIGGYVFEQCTSLEKATLLEGVETIGTGVFRACYSLTDVSLPQSLTSLGGDMAFYNCDKLERITIPNNVTSIPTSTFSECYALKEVRLSPNTTYIGSYAFDRCVSLTEIHLPPYLSSIADDAFCNCVNLKSVYAYMPDIITIGSNSFPNYQESILYVPDFLYNSYYFDTNWSQFLSVRRCELRPGDYESFYTNGDIVFEEGVERITEDTPIAEIGEQGGIIVEGEEQQFDTVDQTIGDMNSSTGTGASLIGDGTTDEDNNLPMNELRVKIKVAAKKWYFFCFPFDVTISECEYPGRYVWRYYDGIIRALSGSGGWQPVTGETLTARQGYAFQSETGGTLVVKFSRPTFGGNRLIELLEHVTENIANASWNFIGNPYSSYYDFSSEDITSPITIWNGNSYEAFRPGDDECHLKPYQAFFVQKPTTADEVDFEAERRETYRQSEKTKANRVMARRQKGINPQRRLINLEILSDTLKLDRARVVLNPQAQHAYELEFDAAKFLSDDATAQLYSLEGDNKMAINERPQQGDIRLGYTASKAGRLSISAPRMDMPMVLVDTKLGVTFDLALGTYDFDTQAGTFDGRFLLRPSKEATAINQLTEKTGVCLGTMDGGLSIGGAEGKTVTVYNTGGAQVASHTGNGFVSLQGGIYVVKVDGESVKMSVK